MPGERMLYKAVIFDLDGTLLNTLADLGNSMNRVLKRNGYPVHDLDSYRYFVGNGVEFLVRRALPQERRDDQTVKKCIAEYRDEYNVSWKNETRPYDGIVELLDKLSSLNIRLAILSNKPHDSTLECVQEFLPVGKFDVILGQRAGTPPKPDPGGAFSIAHEWNIIPENILYLGDTDVDMKTAVSAGMFPVGVLWGFRTGKELAENGAKMLIEKPGELMNVIA